MPRIRRFPRLLKDYPNAKLSKYQKAAMKIAENRVPRGYDHITKRQKKLARLIINGMAVVDACKKMGMDTNTFYRYMHYHPLFKQYYLRYAQHTANEVEGRLDARFGRAVQIIENAMDSPDDYLALGAAEKFLTGRGHYKRSIDSKKQVSGGVKIGVDSKIQHIHEVKDKEFVLAFVQALTGATSGGKVIEPKVVKGKTVSKIINALPESAPNASLDPKIQEINQAKAS